MTERYSGKSAERQTYYAQLKDNTALYATTRCHKIPKGKSGEGKQCGYEPGDDVDEDGCFRDEFADEPACYASDEMIRRRQQALEKGQEWIIGKDARVATSRRRPRYNGGADEKKSGDEMQAGVGTEAGAANRRLSPVREEGTTMVKQLQRLVSELGQCTALEGKLAADLRTILENVNKLEREKKNAIKLQSIVRRRQALKRLVSIKQEELQNCRGRVQALKSELSKSLRILHDSAYSVSRMSIGSRKNRLQNL